MGSENCFCAQQTQDCYAQPRSVAQRRARPILDRMIPASESVSARLALAEGIQRLPTPKAELFQQRGFVPPDLCADLIALIDAGRRPSTIADDNGDPYFRTSETCDLAADLPADIWLQPLSRPLILTIRRMPSM